MIYTSYYSKVKSLPESSEVYSISNSCPISYLPKLERLIPDWNTIVGPYKAGNISKEEYEIRYTDQLNKLSEVYKQTLLKESKDRNSVTILLCYERSEDFCHRHILAKWLNNILNEELVKEYEF